MTPTVALCGTQAERLRQMRHVLKQGIQDLRFLATQCLLADDQFGAMRHGFVADGYADALWMLQQVNQGDHD